MKKIQFISMMALVIMALCSCTNTDYQKAIPANATLVVKMDVRSISEKADFKHSKVMTMLDASLVAVVKGKDMKRVKEYVDDPMKIGLDFSMPLYFFMVGEDVFGLTMKMNDEGDVKDFLQLLNKQGMASKPQEKNGLMCGTLMDDIYYSYDKNTFLLLASMNGKGTSTTSRMAHELMTLKEDDSFTSTEAFDRLNDEGDDLVTYTNGKLGKDILSNVLTALLPSSVNVKDIDVLMSLNFEDGKASFKSKVWGKTDKAQALIDEADKNFGKIEGKYMDRVSDNMLIWASANVKGDWALSKLKQSQGGKELLMVIERAIDIEQMLRSVDGDVALELQMKDFDPNNTPEYVMYATLKNSDFLADVNDWNETMKEYGLAMREEGKNQYLLTLDDGTSMRWGVQDKDWFVASEKADRNGKGADALDAHKDDIKQSKCYIYVDMEKIPFVDYAKQSNMFFLVDALGKLQSAVVKSTSTDEVTLTIELKDKKENFLKQLF